ncbi:hypothetical protein PFISCL1PPCAC_20680, partial [Pristionchus fissidentatus]
MFLLIPLLLVVTTTVATIPPIDGVERSGFFNFMRQEFEKRRLFVNIVDTLSSSTSSVERGTVSATVSIDLLPSEDDPDYYEFISRKIAEILKCDQDADEEADDQMKPITRFLSIDEEMAKLLKDDTEDIEKMLRRIAKLAGVKEEEMLSINLNHCTRFYGPARLRIQVSEDASSQIQSGWIVERYPLGNFTLENEPNYRYPVYVANHSYIDGWSELIVDVHETIDDHGRRVWKRTGWPTFAQLTVERRVNVAKDDNFSFVRETSTGLLIATLAPSLSLSYSLDDKLIREEVQLDGNHFHVTCDRKLGAQYRAHEDRIMRVSLGDNEFSCSRNRATPTGIPELLQLDYMQTQGSIPVPDRAGKPLPTDPTGDEDLSDAGYDEEKREYREQQSKEKWEESSTKYEGQPRKPILRPVEIKQSSSWFSRVSDLSWLEFILLLLTLLSFLITIIMFTAICAREYIKKSRDPVVRAWIEDRHGKDRRRKDGRYSYFSNRELAEASKQSIEAINKKCEEMEKEERKQSTVSSSRPRSLRKTSNSVSFAPRKPSANREELFKLINDAELGIKIDAMIAAGPDGEEEELAAAAAA